MDEDTAGVSRGVWPFAPHISSMAQNSMIYEPAHAGAPFIAALFDPRGQIVASQGFATRGEAEAFIQAFMQENAGAYEL